MEDLLNKYDELHRQLGETYGAHTGHGVASRSAVGLHKLRHDICTEMREVRNEILEYGKSYNV
jgi:hypothetical protein